MAYSLGDSAEQDVRELFAYGMDMFGLRQANIYFDQLHEIFDKIDNAPLSGRLRKEFSNPIRAHQFRSHLIFYVLDNDDVKIIRILHSRTDWQNHGEWF